MKISNPLRRAACVVALSACAATPALAAESGFYLGASLGEASHDVDEGTTGFFEVTNELKVDDKTGAFSLSVGYRIMPFLGIELSYIDLGNFDFVEGGQITVIRNVRPLPATNPASATTLVPTARPAFGFLEGDAGVQGPALSIVGAVPMGNFELYGKVGAIYAKTTGTVGVFSTSTSSAAGPPSIISPVCTVGCTWAIPESDLLYRDSSESTKMLYALGMGYTFNEAFFVRLEWMRVSKVDVPAFTIGDSRSSVSGTVSPLTLALPSEADIDYISLGFQYRF